MNDDARIRGLWCAPLTPLDGAGNVDVPRFAAHLKELFARGVAGAAPFGTTGEGPSFSVAERKAALDGLLGAGIAVGRLAAATGAAAYTDTLSLTRHALHAGVRRCLVVPPFFFKQVRDEAVYAFFARLIDDVADERLRLFLYHIPQFSGVAIAPPVVARLAQAYPSVVAGVKDSEGSWTNTQALLAAAPQLDILVGHEPHLPRLMSAGGAGTICGVANVYPELVAALLAPTVDDAAHARIAAFLEVLLAVPFLPAFKAIRAAQTGDVTWQRVRPPWLPLDDGAARALRDALTRAGFPLP